MVNFVFPFFLGGGGGDIIGGRRIAWNAWKFESHWWKNTGESGYGNGHGGSDGRTLGHKRLYCAQCASNADIGKLLAPSLVYRTAYTIPASGQNRIFGNPEKYRWPETARKV